MVPGTRTSSPRPYDEKARTYPRFQVRPTGRRKRLARGIVQIYTGGGKGKSTAAFGLIARASGHGLRCCLIQFMKKGIYGEIATLGRLPGVHVEQYGSGHWVNRKRPAPEDLALASQALRRGRDAARSGVWDLVVLDEINVATVRGLISANDVLRVISSRHPRTELVLTGRGAPKAVMDQADLVTMMVGMKHPYHRGLDARLGIEY